MIVKNLYIFYQKQKFLIFTIHNKNKKTKSLIFFIKIVKSD